MGHEDDHYASLRLGCAAMLTRNLSTTNEHILVLRGRAMISMSIRSTYPNSINSHHASIIAIAHDPNTLSDRLVKSRASVPTANARHTQTCADQQDKNLPYCAWRPECCDGFGAERGALLVDGGYAMYMQCNDLTRSALPKGFSAPFHRPDPPVANFDDHVSLLSDAPECPKIPLICLLCYSRCDLVHMSLSDCRQDLLMTPITQRWIT